MDRIGKLHTMENTFLNVHKAAKAAAGEAALKADRSLGPEASRGLDCGFAWVQLTPGNHPYVRALKAAGIGDKHWAKGWELWAGSQLHDISTQSIGVHVAAANAYADYLRGLIREPVGQAVLTGLDVSVGSRYD